MEDSIFNLEEILKKKQKKTKKNEKAQHYHKVMRAPAFWRCVNADGSDCRYFVYFKQEHVLIGRTVICWGCTKPFVMTEEAMREEYPRCDVCRNPEVVEYAEFDPDDYIAKKLEKKDE